MNTSKGFLLVLIAIAAVLGLALVAPFIQFVLIAVLLGYVLRPVQLRLADRIGRGPSAFVLVVLATLAILIPLLVIIVWVVTTAAETAADVDPMALGFEPFEAQLEDLTGFDIDLHEQLLIAIEGIGNRLIGEAPDLLAAVVHGLVGVGLAAFLLFFFLKDGDRLVAWIHTITPLPAEVRNTLFERLDELMWAVLVGHVVVAIVQGIIAGLGLWVVGIPNVLLLTIIMIFLALIPLVGSFLVWAPAAVWLVVTGSPIAGIALFVYGAIVVGTSDEFLRPLIVGRADISPAVILVGVIGGIYLLGFVGIFFGPIVVGALKVIMETFDEYYEALEESATSSPTDDTESTQNQRQ